MSGSRRRSDAGPQREREILQAALALAGEERTAFLDTACGEDDELRSRIEQLLAHEEFPTAPSAASAGAAEWGPAGVAHPRQIGPYRLLEPLGEGGMGVVYLAEQSEPVRRQVAVKVVKPGIVTRQVLARFESERQALALMNHPCIARILDVGATEEAIPYFVLEYVPGLPITKYCDSRRLEVRERLRLFLDLCAAIDHAHQRGVIHRDIKPSNVLVSDEGGGAVVKVIDFGIAKAVNQRLSDLTVHTRLGSLIGTPEYMSPEQAELSPLDVDTRSDVYSLGAVLYELLVGAPPLSFGEDLSLLEIQRILSERDPPPPSSNLVRGRPTAEKAAIERSTGVEELRRGLAGDLDWITMKALEKDRNRRYSFASELAADLRRHLEDQPVLAGPPSTAYRLGKFTRRHRGAVVAGALATALLFVGLWGAWGWRRVNRAAELAQGFGQEVSNLEWQLRVAQMSPLHDTTRDRQRIAARLEEIAGKMSQLGSVAQSAGHYALGRGELALGRDDAALGHLEEAWQEGLRGPEVAFARGVALGRLFRRESTRARADPNPERRAERLADVERSYRDPALAALAAARSTAAAPLPYVEALMAFYEERYEDSFRFVEEALAEAPWLWEAYQLRGDALTKVASQRYRESRREEGHQAILDADAAFAAAIKLAPSAAEAYFGRCSSGGYRLFQTLLEAVGDEDYETLRRSVADSCETLRTVQPDHPELGVSLANIHLMTGRRLGSQGKDPRGELERARALAQAAVERQPESAAALRALGDAVLGLGRFGWQRGDDVRSLLAEAAAKFEQAAALEPSLAAVNNAANAHLLAAKLERDRGIDPTASLRQAEELYQRAKEMNPAEVITDGNLALVASDLAEWEMSHGTDPRPRLRDAVRQLEPALERAPQLGFLQLTLCNLAAHLAEAETKLGAGDPEPWIERSRRAANDAIDFLPGTHEPLWNLAQAEREAVRAALQRGADPTPFADAAFSALDRYQELFPDQAKDHRLRGELHLELARYSRSRSQNPVASLGSARRELERAARLQPDQELRVLPLLAELWALELESAADDETVRRHLRPALDVARRIEEIAGEDAGALVAASRLRLIESRLAADPERRTAAAGEARRLEARARAINPLLESSGLEKEEG